MKRILAVAVLALVLTAPLKAAEITGQYIEARTCDVWTGPCFANAEVNFNGKNAVMAWMIDKGSHDGVQLDGLGIVAVIAARDTLGIEQSGPAKAVLIVDKKANASQRQALVRLAQKQGGKLLKNVVKIESADVNYTRCACKADGCSILKAGPAKIETRCLGVHDKLCGNETAFYPPLAKDVKAQAAVASEHSFNGAGLAANWTEHGRRSAYVGSFSIR
jgi:hypothetical protein